MFTSLWIITIEDLEALPIYNLKIPEMQKKHSITLTGQDSLGGNWRLNLPEEIERHQTKWEAKKEDAPLMEEDMAAETVEEGGQGVVVQGDQEAEAETAEEPDPIADPEVGVILVTECAEEPLHQEGHGHTVDLAHIHVEKMIEAHCKREAEARVQINSPKVNFEVKSKCTMNCDTKELWT